jgi:hypothetical protein
VRVQDAIENLQRESPHLAHALMRQVAELKALGVPSPLDAEMPDEAWQHDVFEDDLEEHRAVQMFLESLRP